MGGIHSAIAPPGSYPAQRNVPLCPSNRSSAKCCSAFVTTDSEAVAATNHSETAASLVVRSRAEEMRLGVLESATLSAGLRLSKQVTAALSDWIYHLTGANERASCRRTSSLAFDI